MEQIMALSAHVKDNGRLDWTKKKNRDRADFIRTTEAHLRHSFMDFTALY
jgi:hypothetical protein